MTIGHLFFLLSLKFERLHHAVSSAESAGAMRLDGFAALRTFVDCFALEREVSPATSGRGARALFHLNHRGVMF